MNLQKFLNRKWNYAALAFAFPFLGMLVSMLIRGCSPFGDSSFLYSDMYHQYFPFFVSFREALRSGDSLLYNWNIGMGLNYLGLISYYLASPLNLLSVLVPEGWLLGYFSLLMPIKLGLAGLFFATFLKKLFGKDDLSISLFGTAYAYCAWALGYQWNIMWLDSFALLPLVMLGMVMLLRDKRFMLYTITLFAAVAINYYVGFFVCIFVFLCFFIYEICCWRGIRRFLGDFWRIGIFTVIAIGMTAILMLPTLAALQTTQSGVNSFPKQYNLNLVSGESFKDLLEAMRLVAGNLTGGLEPTFKEGRPNLYCGIGTVLLSVIFLTTRGIRVRDKVCSVFLLLFLALSFIIRQLDYIWHGFHFPNMIPYRFSFLFSFVLLVMAYRAYLLRRRIKIWQLIVAVVPTAGLMLCSDVKDDYLYWVYNGLFLLAYFGILLWAIPGKRPDRTADPEAARKWVRDKLTRRQRCTWALLLTIGVELILTLINFQTYFPGTSITNYPKGKDDTEAIVDYMHQREEDTLFFRAETTHAQTLNDGALNGYAGVSTFTSSANVKVTQFLQSMGFAAKNTYNRYCYEEASPVADLFLALQYMIERDNKVEENIYYEDLLQIGNVHLLENKNPLSLGFLANTELENLEVGTNKNAFAHQCDLFRAATGLRQDVWKMQQGKCLEVSEKNVTVKLLDQMGLLQYETDSSAADERLVTFTYTVTEEGLMAVHLNLSLRNSFTVWKNGVELYSESHTLPQMHSVCQVKPGDVVALKFKCKKDENGRITVRAAVLDEDLFQQGYEILRASQLELTKFQNTHVEGTINANRDGLLYTSIPQDGNWSVAVDGQETPITLVGDVMIAVPLTEGSHEIVFHYENAAFALGSKITIVFAIVLLLLYWIYYRPGHQKGKFEAKKKD